MDPQLTFTATTALTSTIGFLLAGMGAVGGASVLVPFVSNRILPKMKETHLADFLPFEGIAPDGQTVMLKNESVARYYYITGKDQAFLTSEEALSAARLRKDFLDGLSELNVVVRIFMMRRKMSLPPSEGFPNEVARQVADRWNKQFDNAYRSTNVICISAKSIGKLDEAQQVLETSLNSYGVHPITQNPERNPERLTLGGFLGELIAPVSQPSPKAMGLNLSDALAGDVVWFRPDGIIEFSQGTKRRYAIAMGIKKLGDDMNSALTTELMALPIDMTISKHIQPMGKSEALIKLEQHSRLAMLTSFNPSVGEQFEMAKSFVEAMDEYRSSLCTYSSTIFVYADSIEEALQSEVIVRNVVTTNGSTAVRETGATQAAWFLQFPTMDLIPRPYRIFTYSIAFDYALDKPSEGVSNSDWGPGPLCLFRTAMNTVYRHQFHISDQQAAVGHGVVIAPTGSGKTVLMEFLSLMASRHRKVKHYFFDRYRGTAIYNLAMGGKYLSLNSDPLPWSVDGGMNPFDCEDTNDNRTFLKLWLTSLSKVDNDDHKSLREISDAIDLSFEELDRNERSLANIHKAAFPADSHVRKELAKWVNPTQYGPIFNADRDSIDLEGNWLTTFDMTKLLDDTELGAATVSYLLHRIRNAMLRDNSPGFIFIDETEPLLRDKNFLNLFKVALQEFRKIRGVVMSVFQRPEALAAVGVSQLVRSQAGAYYLFQNPGAKDSDYNDFELNEKELAFVLGRSSIARKTKRSILIKRPLNGESVIVDVDLSSLGPMMRIFSSSSQDVELVRDLYRQFEGHWVERYVHEDAP
jgi:type IV secretion/conjugal transfer VirB4 family ATPase